MQRNVSIKSVLKELFEQEEKPEVSVDADPNASPSSEGNVVSEIQRMVDGNQYLSRKLYFDTLATFS